MNTSTLFTLLEQNKEDVSILEDLLHMYQDLINCSFGTNKTYIIIRAVFHGYCKLVEQLIKCPKIDLNVVSDSYNTALILAVWNNHPEIARTLIQAGANVHLKDDRNKTALSYIDHIEDENSRNQIYNLLTEKAQSPVVSNEKKITIDDLTTMLRKYKTNAQLITTLINAHKDIISETPSSSAGLLFMAAHLQSEIMAKALIDAKIDLNCVSLTGNTALLYAIKYNRPEIAIHIIEADADITIKNHDGYSAYDLVDCITDETHNLTIRKLLRSKMPNLEPVETPKPEEIKPVETPSPVETTVSVPPPTEKPVNTEPVAYRLIKFLSDNNLDYTFCNHEITANTSINLVTFALDNNVPYKVSGNNIIITI